MKTPKATEGSRVALEIAAIRAALLERGYLTRKRARQPVWIIFVTPDQHYLLTYQPNPISSWVLHPQNNDLTRNILMTIIQSALTKQPAGITGRFYDLL